MTLTDVFLKGVEVSIKEPQRMASASVVCIDKVSIDVHGLTGNRCVPIYRRAADSDEIVLASQGANHFTQARPCNFLWDRLLFGPETENTCRSFRCDLSPQEVELRSLLSVYHRK